MSAQNPPVQQAMATGNAAIKTEENSLQQQLQSIDWDSERQLISSLSKLQELESKIHELRSLLPDRLLAPIDPIVNPRRTSSSSPIPRNPHVLNSLLRKSMSEGVSEVNSFKDLWLSPDMQALWTRVDQKLVENKGVFPQPSGTWSRDYDLMLKQMDEDEEEKKRGQTQHPNSERDQQQQQPVPASISPPIYGTANLERDGDLKSAVESFQKRQIPGFRIGSSRNESMIVVSLGLAGLLFEIQEVLTTNNAAAASDTNTNPTTPTPGAGTKQALPEWRVSTRQSLGKTGPSRLETGIVQQLNSRARKWDLHYLLELIHAYSNIQSQPCKKCGRLTDSTAQLPIIRKLALSTTTANTNNDTDKQMSNTTAASEANPNGTGNDVEILWDAYHPECI